MSNKSISYRNDRRIKAVIIARLFASLTGSRIDKKNVFCSMKRMSASSIAFTRIEQI